MNLATGTIDRLKYFSSLPPLVQRIKQVNPELEGGKIIPAMYTFPWSGATQEKEYWQLVEAYKSWVYTCVDKIAKSVAMIPLKLFIYRSKQTGKVIRDICWKANYRMLPTNQERKDFLRDSNLEKEEIFEHPFLELMSLPNPLMTRFTLWYNTVIRLEIGGLCGWLKIKDGLKVTRQIYPLPLTKYAKLNPKVSSSVVLEGWEYRDGDVVRKFAPDQVFPMIYPHPASPFQGMSPLMAQTYPYDIDLFLMQQQKAFFEHGANPGLHLSTDQQLRKDQVKELKEQIDEQYGGSLRAGETLITHSGLKAVSIGTTSRQSMIDEVAKFARDKLITAFDLSPGKVGLIDDVNRASMQGLDRIYIHECLRPKCMLVEEAIETFLLPDYDKGLTCDFELPSTEDQEYELKAMGVRLQNKVTVVNQERLRLGMEPADWGDLPWGSYTDIQIGGAIDKNIPPVDNSKKRLSTKRLDFEFWTEKRKEIRWKLFIAKGESLEHIFLPPMRRYFKDQCEQVVRRLDREGKKIESLYVGWSRQRVQQHLKENKVNLRAINIDKKEERKVLTEKFTPVIQVIMKERGDEVVDELSTSTSVIRKAIAIAIDFNVNDPRVLKWLGQRMRTFSESVSGTTFDDIESILREGFTAGESIVTISDTLRSKFDSYDKYRAPLIARTETMSAMNRADLESVRQTGLENDLLKHWLTAQDEHVRESHQVAGKEYEEGIAIDENFKVGQDEMEAPGLGSDPGENINCRCTLYYTEIVEEE